MTPQKMKADMIDELQNSYNLDRPTAVDMAMFAVDRVINYSGIYDDTFWMELMEELDNDRFTRR